MVLVYPTVVRGFIRDRSQTIASREDFEEYYTRVSSTENLRRRRISSWTIILGLPLTMFSIGLGFNIGGTSHKLVSLPVLAALWFDVSILLFLMFWGERKLFRTVINIRPAFDVEDEAYYRFVGRLFKRLYQPSPFAALQEGFRLNSLGFLLYGGSFFLLLMIATQLPERLLVFDGSGPSIGLQAYILATIGMVSFSLCHGFWSTGWLTWFMGIRSTSLPLRFSVIRSADNLGLHPYGDFILRASLLGFTGLMATGGVYLASPHPLLLVVTGLGSLLLIGWYIGAQFGLHRAMVQTKRAVYRRFVNKYTKNTNRLLNDPIAETSSEMVVKTHCAIEIKREIEKAPTWPGNIRGLLQLASAAFISHLPFYVQFFGLV